MYMIIKLVLLPSIAERDAAALPPPGHHGTRQFVHCVFLSRLAVKAFSLEQSIRNIFHPIIPLLHFKDIHAISYVLYVLLS